MSGISSEVLRVLLGEVLPLRALVIHRVLQAVPVFALGGVPARVLVPTAPVLTQVLESGQVPILGCGMARACTPSTVVLSRPLQHPYTSPQSSVVTYVGPYIRLPQFHQEVQRLSRRVETELRRCPTWIRYVETSLRRRASNAPAGTRPSRTCEGTQRQAWRRPSTTCSPERGCGGS